MKSPKQPNPVKYRSIVRVPVEIVQWNDDGTFYTLFRTADDAAYRRDGKGVIRRLTPKKGRHK